MRSGNRSNIPVVIHGVVDLVTDIESVDLRCIKVDSGSWALRGVEVVGT